MWARLESNTIKEILIKPKALTIGGVQYPSNVFSVWSTSELATIGIVPITIDNTNFKDKEYYVNTNITYAYSTETGKATGTYGTATAKKIADTLWTEQDKTDGKIPSDEDVGDVATEGLKTIKKKLIDNQCAGLLAPSDWRVVKATETGGTMDSGWKTWRASVRTKCNSMQTQIDNASDVDALAALFTRDKDGVRPLGDFPVKE